MKRIAIIVAIVGGFLLLIPIVDIAVFRYNQWPAISDENKSAILVTLAQWRAENPDKRIPEDKWTPELKELKPRIVSFENGQIDVLISSGGIGPGWGYYITDTGVPDSKGMILVKSKDARFQKYRQRN